MCLQMISMKENIFFFFYPLQALTAAETSLPWNCEGAIRNILSLQDDEGLIADSLGITFLAIDALGGQSMANVDEIEPECNTPNA